VLKRRLLRALGHQHALRFGFRDRILRRFDDPDRTSSAEFVVPFYGATYRGNFDTFIDWSVYYYGAYERDDLELIGDFLAALGDPVFVDVGANVGHHTLFAAMRCRRVIALEPFEPLVRRIRQKVADNSLVNVTIVACGLGERDETAPYTPSSTNNTGTGAFGVSSSGAAVMLPVRRGDEVLAEADGSSVGFLKIDTEGFEAHVLRGLSRTLAAARPLVWFEWSERMAADRADARDLFPGGYAFYRRAPDRSSLGILRRPAGRLESLTGRWPEADILAVPGDFAARVATNPSAARALARLGRASEQARTIPSARARGRMSACDRECVSPCSPLSRAAR
jgi:FkbM family methyltransferase